jgi:group I intron endonuclease
MDKLETEVIYKITSPSGKVYIGRTKNFNGRMAEHKCNALTKKANNSIYKAIRKYGWDSMKIEIICEVDALQSKNIEEELIRLNNSVKTGYNDTYLGSGGDIWLDRKDSVEYMEWIEKMKVINKGENNGMYGKVHNTSTTYIMKQKAKGRFTLDWFIQRNGVEEGTRLYEERCIKLKNRNMPKDENGKFIKEIKKSN